MSSSNVTDPPDLQGYHTDLVASLQISAINVSLARPFSGHPIIKLIVNQNTKVDREFSAKDDVLIWDLKPPFNLRRGETSTIGVYEKRWARSTKTIKEVSISFEEALEKISNSPINDTEVELSRDPQIRIQLSVGDESLWKALREGIEALNMQNSVLSRLGKTRKLLETVLTVGVKATKVHSASKDLLTNVQEIYEGLAGEELRHRSILELAENMTSTLTYVMDVEQFAELDQLNKTIEEIRPLVEETTNLILEVSLRRKTDKFLRLLISSSDQVRIDEINSRFDKFKEKFDRGISVDSAKSLHALLARIEEENLLEELKPKDIELGSPHFECKDGTREDILAVVDEWTKDLKAPNMLWLKGHPGVGKSAIASTVVKRLLSSGRLASCFFFQRDRESYTSPNILWRSVAFDLGRRYPLIRRELAAKLKGKVILPSTAMVDDLFDHFIRDTLEENKVNALDHPIIVVIDALDECGGFDGQTSTSRKGLMRNLKRWSKLPSKCKILVTSREEADIERVFSSVEHTLIEVYAGDMVTPQSSQDIYAFLKERFQEIANASESLPSDWPGTTVTEALANEAAGLFIWASTILEFVESGEPESRLKRITEGEGKQGLKNLYIKILKIAFDEMDQEVIGAFRAIMGMVILAKDHLPVSSIPVFLSITDGMKEHICSRLRAVLHSGEVLRIRHQSFSDFLVDTDQCPEAFLIIKERESRTLSLACLKTMCTGLKFNLCALESSHIRNRDVPDLTLRVQKHLSPHLQYSCSYWSEHLAWTRCDSDVLAQIQQFMHHYFLFWLEALSVCKKVNLASNLLSILTSWMRRHQQEDYMVTDMEKFVTSFAGPISESAPHIYLSALSFPPSVSPVAKHYRRSYSRLINIDKGGLEDWSITQNVLIGHTDWVTSVAFSPDSKRIASGSFDKTIRIWDAETGEPLAGPFEGHTDAICSVNFSPDGLHIASGSRDKTVRLWNSKTGMAKDAALIGHTDSVMCVAFSFDGELVASGSDDRTVRLWNIETGEVQFSPFKGHTDLVRSVAFSPTGYRIVSGSDDKLIYVWDGRTGERIAGPFIGHEGKVRSVAFSRDGKRIVSGSGDRRVRVWNAETGKPVASPFRGHDSLVRSVTFSHDDTRIVSASEDKTIRVWDSQTGKLKAGPFQGHAAAIASVAFSLNGKRIASGGNDKTIRVWDARATRVVARSLDWHESWISAVRFSTDGASIVSGSADGTIRRWNGQTGTLVRLLGTHKAEIWSICLSRDGRRIASGSRDRTVRIWDIKTGNLIAGPFEGHTAAVTSVALTFDGGIIVSGSMDKTIRVWDTATGRSTITITGHTQWVNSISLSFDDRFIVTGSGDSTICVWDIENGNLVKGPIIGHDSSVMSVSFSPDGSRIVSGSKDKTVRQWHTHTGEPVGTPLLGHTGEVSSVVFSPNGKYIVSGSYDRTIRIWDSETGGMIAGPYQGHTDIITSVEFSPDGNRIASGSWDKTIRVWEAEGALATKSTPLFPGFVPHLTPDDGWVLGPNSELLFWVPPELRKGLMHQHALLVIGAKIVTTKLNLEGFIHGVPWTNCRDL